METLLDSLKVNIQNITRTAAAIDLAEPGFADAFHPPKAYNPAALLTTADAFILKLAVQTGDTTAVKNAKAALVAKFVAHEMKSDFAATLQADRAAIADEQGNMEADHEDGMGNTAVINPLIRKGKNAVATLDAIMHNKYSGQPDKLAAWTGASHVERDPHRKKKTPTPIPKTPEQK